MDINLHTYYIYLLTARCFTSSSLTRISIIFFWKRHTFSSVAPTDEREPQGFVRCDTYGLIRCIYLIAYAEYFEYWTHLFPKAFPSSHTFVIGWIWCNEKNKWCQHLPTFRQGNVHILTTGEIEGKIFGPENSFRHKQHILKAVLHQRQCHIFCADILQYLYSRKWPQRMKSYKLNIISPQP